MNYLLVVQVFVRTPSRGLVGHFCVEINTTSFGDFRNALVSSSCAPALLLAWSQTLARAVPANLRPFSLALIFSMASEPPQIGRLPIQVTRCPPPGELSYRFQAR